MAATEQDPATMPPDVAVFVSGLGERKPTFNEAWNENMTLNLVNLLMLRSLSVHVGYWDRQGSPANAFGLFVELVLKKTPVLH